MQRKEARDSAGAIPHGNSRTGEKREAGTMPAPPATNRTTMGSPILLDMPSMQAVPMPEKAAGTTTLAVVSQRVAPSASEASRRETGTA